MMYNRVRIVSVSCFDSIYLLMCNVQFFSTILLVLLHLCLLLGESSENHRALTFVQLPCYFNENQLEKAGLIALI